MDEEGTKEGTEGRRHVIREFYSRNSRVLEGCRQIEAVPRCLGSAKTSDSLDPQPRILDEQVYPGRDASRSQSWTMNNREGESVNR